MAPPDITALLHQLRSHSTSTQIRAAQGLTWRPGAAASDAIAAAGGVSILLRLLQSRSEAVQAAAVAAICNLARRSELCRRSLVDLDAVEVIVRLLSSNTQVLVKLGAISTLQNLTCAAGVPAASAKVVAAGGLGVLI